MAIQFHCPHCAAAVKVPDAAAGKVGKCPQCEASVRVPEIVPPRPAAPPPVAVAPQPTPATAAGAPVVAKGQLLTDHSAVFVLPPPVAPAAPATAVPPAAPPAAPSPPAEEQRLSAREEYIEGEAWLKKHYVPGAGWPAADRAVQHYSRAAQLDPRNVDYATKAGIACVQSIERFLESWGKGPIISIAAFHSTTPLGQQMHKAERIFRPSGLSPDNLKLLQDRAAEGLNWFSQALAIEPQDAVARCHRATLLRNIGAFPAALADVKGVLASPLVPSKTRDAAQAVADFILEEDSPLRKFLTRSEAQHLPGPPGVPVPADEPPAPPPPAPTSRPAAPPPDVEPDPFLINVAGGQPATPAFPPPLFGAAGSLAPTQADIPMVVAGGASTAAPTSVAARLKRRRGANWLTWAIPVGCGVLLIAAYFIYSYISQPTFTGDLVGTDRGPQSVGRTIFRNEFNAPEDRVTRMLVAFRDDPKVLPTEFRVLTLRGTGEGLQVSNRAASKGRLVSVDVRANPALAAWCRDPKIAARLEAARADATSRTLASFINDFEQASSARMQMGNFGDYLTTLGGDVLVQGLGYHVVARAEGNEFPCIFEDSQGVLYFLVPAVLTAFTVEERTFPDQERVFDREFKFHVLIQPAAAQPASAPAPDAGSTPQAPLPDTLPEAPGTGTDAAANDPAMKTPAGFYGPTD